MIPVSVVIITKNEEQNIRDAIESVKDFSEIVVIDSFSSDRAVDISKKYTEKVYEEERIDTGTSLQLLYFLKYAEAWERE